LRLEDFGDFHLFREQPEQWESHKPRQVGESYQERQVAVVCLGHTSQLCCYPTQELTKAAREIVDAHECSVERRLDSRRAQAGPENEHGHEPNLAKDRQDYIVANRKPSVGQPDCPVEMRDEDEGRHAEDDARDAHPLEQDFQGDLLEVLVVGDDAGQARDGGYEAQPPKKLGLEAELIGLEEEESRPRGWRPLPRDKEENREQDRLV